MYYHCAYCVVFVHFSKVARLLSHLERWRYELSHCLHAGAMRAMLPYAACQQIRVCRPAHLAAQRRACGGHCGSGFAPRFAWAGLPLHTALAWVRERASAAGWRRARSRRRRRCPFVGRGPRARTRAFAAQTSRVCVGPFVAICCFPSAPRGCMCSNAIRSRHPRVCMCAAGAADAAMPLVGLLGNAGAHIRLARIVAGAMPLDSIAHRGRCRAWSIPVMKV